MNDFMNTIEPNIILGALLVFFVLIVLLVGLFVTYIYVVQKSINSGKSNGDGDKIDPDKLILEVQAKSLKILEDAHKKAKDILSDAQEFLRRDESKIALQVEKIGKTYVDVYESTLNNIKLEAIKTIHNIPKDINESFSKSLIDFQEDLKTELHNNQEKLTAATLENIKKSENEIEKHKAFRVRQIDESVVSLVSEIAKKVLARDITGLEHEKLVLKALEEAKKEGIFNN